jgi:hypothetical protein
LNSVAVSGVAKKNSASALGAASRNVTRSPQSSSAEYSCESASTCAFDRLGSRIVPSATPSSAVGNYIRRSA